MTIGEQILFRRIVELLVRLDNCNPDIGMAPTKRVLAEEEAEKLDKLGFSVEEWQLTEMEK